MPHTDAVANRFDHTAVMARHFVERCGALSRATFLAMAKAWSAYRDTHRLMEMSDHILKDIGIERDTIYGAGASRYDRGHDDRTRSVLTGRWEEPTMGTSNTAVPPGQESTSPGRSFALKLQCGETGGSIMMFEETIPAGTKSTFHLHHDSDEVGYVLSGEITFLIGDDVTVGGPGACIFMPRGVRHAWKNTSAHTGRVLFLYTPAKAGGLIEEQQRTGRKFGSMNERELADILQRHGWALLGPSPL